MTQLVLTDSSLNLDLEGADTPLLKIEFGPQGPRGLTGPGLPTGMSIAFNVGETALIVSVDGVPHSMIVLHDIP